MDVSRQTSRIVMARVGSVNATLGLAGILGVFIVLSVGFPTDGTSQGIVRSEAGLRMFVLGQASIRHELDFDSPQSLEQATQYLTGADVTFTNLEGAIQTRDGMPASHTGTVHRASPGVLKSLKAAHVNLLALSSNHAFDLGAPGVTGTIELTRKLGFTVAGTGRNAMDAAAPAYLDTAKGRVGLVAAACGGVADVAVAGPTRLGVNVLRVSEGGSVSPEDSARILAAIREAKSRALYVLVYLHNHCFDQSHPQTPPAWLTEWAHSTIDSGATVFVTHGSPFLQGVEVYRKRPIFYGLGSFVFETPRINYYASNTEAWQSVVADVRFDGEAMHSLRFRPIVLHETTAAEGGVFFPAGVPRLANEAQGAVILKRLAELSRPFRTLLTITGTTAELSLSPNE